MDFLKEHQKSIIIVLIVVVALYFLFGLRRVTVEKFVATQTQKDSGIDNYKVDQMKCSPQCCSDQWPTGLEVKKNGEGAGMVGNSFRCSNGVTSGCPCMNKDQSNFLSHRGNNFPVGFDTEIPASYIIYPENPKLYENKKGPAIGFVATQGQLYGLPNQGAIYNANGLLA